MAPKSRPINNKFLVYIVEHPEKHFWERHNGFILIFLNFATILNTFERWIVDVKIRSTIKKMTNSHSVRKIDYFARTLSSH